MATNENPPIELPEGYAPGILCPECLSTDSTICRTIREPLQIVRERICLSCGALQQTVERPQAPTNGHSTSGNSEQRRKKYPSEKQEST